jgi:lipopolysaccharide transport system ATP-binding protein
VDDGAVIRVRGLGKQYHIGGNPAKGSLYDRMAGLVGGRREPPEDAHPTIWALRDVTFDVPPGRVLGVIGLNGSGKSTLMRILARVTVPTVGYAETYGRIGSLLSVGTGFHPELSGRDNIALSGAMLGMSRQEILECQDRIVDFAGIGKFLDTPVKHYSSGMYMRLAFSVSAHLATEIMLVDEVLAVGDATFQQRCMDRIRQVVREGRTVLFVSHAMDSVRDLCDDGLVLHQGEVVYLGSAGGALEHYSTQILGEPPAPPPAIPATVGDA